MVWILGTDSNLSKALCLFSLVLGFSMGLRVPAASESSPKVLEIVSQSLSKARLHEVEETLGLSLDSPVDLVELDRGIRKLQESGKYLGIRVRSEKIEKGKVKGIRLLIEGSAVKNLTSIKWVDIPEEVLEESGVQKELLVGRTADPRAFAIVKDRLKKAYESLGHYFAVVEVKTKELEESGDAEIEVRVNPGEPTRITKWGFTGITAELKDKLASRVRLKTGQPLERKNIEQSVEGINTYLRANQYPTAKVEETGLTFSEDKKSVDLEFVVHLGSRFQFEFVGNTVFDSLNLRELLTEEVLSQSDAVVRVAAQIEEKYKAVGYHFCRVEPRSIPLSGGGERSLTRFQVEEGPKVLIDSVEFDGWLDPEAGNLEKIFISGAPGVISRRLFWEAGLTTATQNFISALEERGFVSATVTGPRIIFSGDKKGVRLFYDIRLGNQYRLSGTKWEGVKGLTQEELVPLLPFSVGDPVNRNQLKTAVQTVQQKYESRGYIDVKIDVKENALSENLGERRTSTEIVFKVSEGPRYKVGDVSVEGLNRTHEKVVLREIILQKGEDFDPKKLRQSEENLYLLGLFSRVEILAVSRPSEPQTKDLKVVVSEVKAGFGELGLGGFYEDPRFRLKSFLGVGYKNVFGLNHTASSRLELSLPISREDDLIPFLEYAAILGYKAPYLFDLPFAFSTQIALDSFEVSTDGRESKIQTRARLEEKLEKKFSRVLTATYRLHHLERTTTETKNSSTPSDPVTDVIGSTGPGITLDFRNDLFNPTSGSYHAFDVEFAHPALLSNDDLSFVMALSRNSFYFPLFDPLRLSIFIGGGYAQALMNKPLPEARLVNELALGGQGSIRGYSPKIFKNSNTRESAFYNFRTELTSVLFGNLSGAIFFDTGQLYDHWSPSPRYDGIGFGFRYKTPVGPVVIDFGHALNSDLERDKIKFSFTVGAI